MTHEDSASGGSLSTLSRRCLICGTPFTPARRSQRTCTEACKKKLARTENRDGNSSKSPSRLGLYRTPQKPQFSVSQVIEKIGGAVPVLDDLSEPSPFVFERINEITWKVTDGVKIRHAAGTYFAGADQRRALAWLMDIGWNGDRQAWFVRVGDVSYGPTTFAKAKKAAVLILQGGFEAPVTRVKDGPTHLRQQMIMLEGEGA